MADYQIIPVKSEPLFTDEQYEEFRKRWEETMTPILKEQQISRAKSVEEIANQIWD